MIDLNGPDIETVDEVKALILESVSAWKNYKMRMPSRSSTGVTRPSRSAQGRSNVYSHLSGLEDVVFNDFIKDYFIQEGDGQVVSGSESLPDPVTLETEDQNLEREKDEHDVLEALGEYKCDAGMSVENVPAVVNIKNTEGTIYCTQVLYWVGSGGGEECGKEQELLASLQSSISQKRIDGLKN